MQTAGKHKVRSFGENSRKQEGRGMWAKAKEKSKKEAKKQAEHGESTGRKPRHSGTKKT